MNIPFTVFYRRLQQAAGIVSQTELARALGVNRSAVTQAKMRDAVPQKWILALARHYSLSADWLEFGQGAPRPGKAAASPPGSAGNGFLRPPVASGSGSEELIYVPKASARLCAGGGSFEVNDGALEKFPMPLRWLSRLGSPTHMVFMDVVGDSMEPGIMDGDTVLIDRANSKYADKGVLAVGLEDVIYLKRMEKTQEGLLLHSDNARYAPLGISGDELDSFRIIGRVVWLCRDSF